MNSNKSFYDRLFHAKHCERCNASLENVPKAYSFVSDEVLCVECKETEMKTEEYKSSVTKWKNNLSKIFSDNPIPRRGRPRKKNKQTVK